MAPYSRSDVFAWIFRIPEEYLTLLSKHEIVALVILAYLAILLRQLDTSWWTEGWSFVVISKVYSLLDEASRLQIRLPIEEIGWIPS